MVAVKRIRLEGLSEEDVNQLMKEVELVKRLSHPSIVKYEGMARDHDTLNIVLEHVFFWFGVFANANTILGTPRMDHWVRPSRRLGN